MFKHNDGVGLLYIAALLILYLCTVIVATDSTHEVWEIVKPISKQQNIKTIKQGQCSTSTCLDARVKGTEYLTYKTMLLTPKNFYEREKVNLFYS